jgi:hypothetical protein
MFNNEVDLTPEDYDILMYLLDETSISVDDGNDNAIMNDMTILSDIQCKYVIIYIGKIK